MSGLNIWNPVTAKFVHYRNISEDKNSLTNNTIFGLEEVEGRGIYAATFGGGLNQYKVDNNQWHQITNSLSNKATNLENRIMSLMVSLLKNQTLKQPHQTKEPIHEHKTKTYYRAIWWKRFHSHGA
jgi:hypothetical protein